MFTRRQLQILRALRNGALIQVTARPRPWKRETIYEYWFISIGGGKQRITNNTYEFFHEIGAIEWESGGIRFSSGTVTYRFNEDYDGT